MVPVGIVVIDVADVVVVMIVDAVDTSVVVVVVASIGIVVYTAGLTATMPACTTSHFFYPPSS